MVRIALLVVMAMTLMLAAPAAAQDRPVREASASVVGTVRAEDGRPLSRAEVHVPASGRGAVTDDAGRFEVALPPGRHVLHVSLLGHAPVRREVVAAAGAPVEVEVVLRATPLSLPGIQVTGRTGSDDPLAVVQSSTQLAGRALERELGGTVAGTLARQPGIAVRSMGPAAALPVMRGLTGDRILVLHDGQRAGDLAGSADDHGMTIDPLVAQRVEVVRGPATLLYGNNALGGVVNVISSDIPARLPSRPEYAFAAQAETAYPGGSASARATLPLSGQWSLGVRAGGRLSDDMRIPTDPILGRRLENTGRRDWNGSLGVGYTGERRSGGVALRGYDFSYGLPMPPDAEPISLHGRRLEASGRTVLAFGSSLLRSIEFDGSYQDYRHDEVDDGSDDVLQAFALETATVNLLVRQGGIGPVVAGAWGVSVLHKAYAATGPEALTPPAGSRGVGVFAFQEIDLGWPALEVGARLDDYRITATPSDKFGPARRRQFRAGSGSVGLRLPLAAVASASGSISRSFRAPTVEELFSGAAHAGTGAVEFGNPELRAEHGTAWEAVLRLQDARWNGQLSVYRSIIRDYVHLVAAGDTLLGGVLLPVLAYAGTQARLQGVEGAVEWAVTPHIVASAMGDYIHARQQDGTPLSFMPPGRLGFGARRDGARVSFGGDVDYRFRQGRVGPADEEPTPAFTLLRLHGSLRFERAGRLHTVSLRAENLGNRLYREATSRIKDFAPAAGRSVGVLYRVHW
jgi:iron complex outermembrane recepter protein